MWVTIASVVVYLAYNSAGMYVTEELGAVRLLKRTPIYNRLPRPPPQSDAVAAGIAALVLRSTCQSAAFGGAVAAVRRLTHFVASLSTLLLTYSKPTIPHRR